MTSESTIEPAGRAEDLAEEPGAARIVVGVDGSPGAFAALVWALAAAARTGADVEVVSTFPLDTYWTDPLLPDPRRIEAIRSDTEARARVSVAEAMAEPTVTAVPRETAVDVRFTVVAGTPSEHLVQRAEGARMPVVGSRGRGGVRSTLLGSVALHCSTHAPCPVVVVHPTPQPTAARVVVGVDESEVSRAALARAVEEAGPLGAEVEAVAVSQPVTYWGDLTITLPPVDETLDEVQRQAEAIVSEVLGDVAGRGVRVTAEVGAPGDVLVRKAEGAALLVVGSRSRNRLTGMLLGSVALHCVVHAPCPVLVVRPEPVRVPSVQQPPAVPSHS